MVVSVLGDPDRLCDFLSAAIAGGNVVKIVRKTQNNAVYEIVFESVGIESFILMEDGSYLLLENGDRFIL